MQAQSIENEDKDGTRRRREAAIALLQSWREEENEEAQEQSETWRFLQTALNENRLSTRRRV